MHVARYLGTMERRDVSIFSCYSGLKYRDTLFTQQASKNKIRFFTPKYNIDPSRWSVPNEFYLRKKIMFSECNTTTASMCRSTILKRRSCMQILFSWEQKRIKKLYMYNLFDQYEFALRTFPLFLFLYNEPRYYKEIIQRGQGASYFTCNTP